MFNLSKQKQVKLHTSLLVTTDTMTTASPINNLLPLTWARTQEHLDMMGERAAQSIEIAAFCHEVNKSNDFPDSWGAVPWLSSLVHSTCVLMGGFES